jgi:hypothetical protein
MHAKTAPSLVKKVSFYSLFGILHRYCTFTVYKCRLLKNIKRAAANKLKGGAARYEGGGCSEGGLGELGRHCHSR